MAAIELYRQFLNGIAWNIEPSCQLSNEKKYAFQVGLKDLDFDVNEGLLKLIGLTIPFQSIDQAEQALRYGAIKPTQLFEEDDTKHQVLVFDPRPIGYSGFMDCATHSLVLTSLGLFEVGRYSAVNFSSQSHAWQWFLHRRLMDREEVNEWEETMHMTQNEFMEAMYKAYYFD
jgi:hypothetical protein